MSHVIRVDLDGYEFGVEVAGAPEQALQPATGASDIPERTTASFGRAVEILGVISSKFGEVFKDKKIGAAEITLGVKLTAKGDFIVVGSSAEATLTMKLTLQAS